MYFGGYTFHAQFASNNLRLGVSNDPSGLSADIGAQESNNNTV